MNQLETNIAKILALSHSTSIILSQWLHKYLQGEPIEPRIQRPYSPDGSQGLYLIDLLIELQRRDVNLASQVKRIFADASLVLLSALIGNVHKTNEVEPEYILDLIGIADNSKSSDPAKAAQILSAAKADLLLVQPV